MCYYKLLNVSTKATADEVKASYYVLAKKYHPDAIKEEDKEKSNVILSHFTSFRIFSKKLQRPTLFWEIQISEPGMTSLSSGTPLAETSITRRPTSTGKTENQMVVARCETRCETSRKGSVTA